MPPLLLPPPLLSPRWQARLRRLLLLLVLLLPLLLPLRQVQHYMNCDPTSRNLASRSVGGGDDRGPQWPDGNLFLIAALRSQTVT